MYYASSHDIALLDELAIRHGLDIAQMMELAAWHLMTLCILMNIAKQDYIVILAGKGNNGGGGIAAARHMYNYGWKRVRIVLAEKDKHLSPNAAHHLALARKMRVPVVSYHSHSKDAKDDIERADVIIDALLGSNLSGDPRGPYAELITLANDASAQIIALDIPSGLNPNTGGCHNPCIKADATLMLALAKHCCRVRKDREHLGNVYLADLGVPAWMYDLVHPGARPSFSSTGIVSISPIDG